MRRLVWLVGLMALGSPACARDYSFVFRGHDIHIEAARHCRSLSCVSVLVGDRHHRRDRDEDEVATVRDSASAPAGAPAQPVPAPVQTLPAVRAPIAPAPAMLQSAPQPVQAPLQVQPAPPPPVPVQPAPMAALALASAPPAPPPAVAVQTPPAPMPPPPVKLEQPKPPLPARVEEAESDDDTPVGDWQTEGKTNLVRIETCGAALCGFVLDAATRTKGESVLINMKPRKDSDAEWTGNVYSRASGNSYYGTMTLKDGKTLRVEACALGSFFCSGNNWARIEHKPASADDLISSHETAARVRS